MVDNISAAASAQASEVRSGQSEPAGESGLRNSGIANFPSVIAAPVQETPIQAPDDCIVC